MKKLIVLIAVLLGACGPKPPLPEPGTSRDAYVAEDCTTHERILKTEPEKVPIPVPFKGRNKIWVDVVPVEGWKESSAYLMKVEGEIPWLSEGELRALDDTFIARYRSGRWKVNKSIDLVPLIDHVGKEEDGEIDGNLYIRVKARGRGVLPANAETVETSVLLNICNKEE